ncbi:MAG: CTP-dependent riboflavin kinase [Methanobacterium sp.]|nr:CTP-dependent riboflavin kinase [Methanobacterium sp.]
MEVKGIITSGQGKGAYFMSLPVYKTQFKDKLNFSPFPGTLNIKIGTEEINNIHDIPEDKLKIIKGKENFGDVLLIKAVLNEEIDGAVVFPKKTTHGENILEFIAAENIKKKLNVEDGDSVKIRFEY